MSNLSARTTFVVGASRGLGRGIATALAEAGAPVVAVSRTATSFPEPTGGAGTIQTEVTNAGAATVPAISGLSSGACCSRYSSTGWPARAA